MKDYGDDQENFIGLTFAVVLMGVLFALVTWYAPVCEYVIKPGVTCKYQSSFNLSGHIIYTNCSDGEKHTDPQNVAEVCSEI